MCGIAGYVGTSPTNEMPERLKKLNHRGPDDKGTHQWNNFHLGMTRLSIIDIEGGHQPMIGDSGEVVVLLNGEIYNYIELRQRLQDEGRSFKTQSDTEVVLALYEKYGIDFIEHLNGMFAICILDKRSEDLYLIRDRMGEKPIYYSQKNEERGFQFASEFKALDINRDVDSIDADSLAWFFSQKAMPQASSIHEDVLKVPAGHYLRRNKNDEIEIKPYYRIQESTKNSSLSQEDVALELERLLKEAVRMRMRADVEVGAFLSGGVDSSLIVAIASEFSKTPLKTYCLVYEDDIYNKKSDQHFSREVAKQYGAEHHEVLLTPEKLVENLETIVCSYGEPNASVVSNWFVSQEMAKKLKVALSGDGADELMGSYFLHRVAAYQASLNGQADSSASFEKEKEFLELLPSPSIDAMFNQFGVFKDKELVGLLSPDVYAQGAIMKALGKRTGQLASSGIRNRMLEAVSSTWLVEQALNYTDMLGMAHSLEIRIPFLDPNVIDFCYSINEDFKIQAGQTKRILKKIAEKYLPSELIHRPKEGFVEPGIHWLNHQVVKDYCLHHLNAETFNRFGFLNQDYVQKIVSNFYKESSFDQGRKVWCLLMYALWEKNYRP